jgi:hypothetical protein
VGHHHGRRAAAGCEQGAHDNSLLEPLSAVVQVSSPGLLLLLGPAAKCMTRVQKSTMDGAQQQKIATHGAGGFCTHSVTRRHVGETRLLSKYIKGR